MVNLEVISQSVHQNCSVCIQFAICFRGN